MPRTRAATLRLGAALAAAALIVTLAGCGSDDNAGEEPGPAATTAVLSGALWLQHARGGWPFAPHEQAVVSAAPPEAIAQDMAGMTAGAMPDRVPVEVTPSMLQALGVRIEEVGRESLIQTIQAEA